VVIDATRHLVTPSVDQADARTQNGERICLGSRCARLRGDLGGNQYRYRYSPSVPSLPIAALISHFEQTTEKDEK
jgi:hypothetical protein